MIELLKSKGFELSENTTLTSLSGGVSCDIALVRDGSHSYVVKQALAKLKVKQDWFADTNRNMYEQRYLKYLNKILPDYAPKVLASFENENLFVMEYLGDQYCDWKQDLMQSKFDIHTAELIGKALGLIHKKSWLDPVVATLFDSDENFNQLRLSPYFMTLVDIYPEHSQAILALCKQIQQNKYCLVHGDFSPKNILVKQGDIKIIDCEVAWYGDPAFDIAFMLHHLLIKFFHFKQTALLDLSYAFITAYKSALGEELFSEIAFAHIIKITALLMIARIDGKSPVEYLSEIDRQHVRAKALALFTKQITTYTDLQEEIKNEN
ncbi:phosphotransferase [Colwellia sp. MSW7]|uniref:Phosphotransferase n=1 Tax=Colwellia maritima TaxID=2912588 RepID=A0ABS9X328_9GAMM|nr:aminoglycoside phosphotransferase family protein [Colwellia maritima]MCI2283886.1 phosphotransferase [Colwellia maritima]